MNHPYDPYLSSLYVAHAPRSPMAAAISIATRAGASGSNVMICGEPGTGKETLARLVHQAGRHPESRFVVVQCAGGGSQEIGPQLLDAQPPAGTVYLEDADELSPSLQARLVQWLDANTDPARPGPWARPRLVASSTRDLAEEVSLGRFRRDLFGALECSVKVLPLRERRDDVLPVWDCCWGAVSGGRTLSSGARQLIKQYTWPGNARELRAFAARVAAACPWQSLSTRDVELQLFSSVTGIPAHAFPACVTEPAPMSEALSQAIPHGELRRLGVEVPPAPIVDGAIDLPELLRGIETTLIDWALARSHGNKAVAARALGLRRTTLVEKLRRFNGARPPEPASMGWHSSTRREA